MYAYNSYRLPSVEANANQWRLLRSLIGSFQQYFKEKTSPFGEKESSSIKTVHGFTCPAPNGQIQRIPL